jgi:hypothetical protein
VTLNDDEFRIWVERQPRGVGQLGFRGAMLKDGPQVAKTVTMSEYGDTSRQCRNISGKSSAKGRFAVRPVAVSASFGGSTRGERRCAGR